MGKGLKLQRATTAGLAIACTVGSGYKAKGRKAKNNRRGQWPVLTAEGDRGISANQHKGKRGGGG